MTSPLLVCSDFMILGGPQSTRRIGARRKPELGQTSDFCDTKTIRFAPRRSGARHLAAILGFGALTLATMGIANAGSSVSFDVSAPQIKKAGDITITIGPDGEKGTPYTVHVNPDMKAADKANAIASVLGTPSGPFTVDYKSGSSTVKLTNMPAVSDVSFDVGTTGERKDSIRITGAAVLQASVQFNNGNFDPLDSRGDFAVFTAGFSTDVGELQFSFSSQSLPDTSGTTIADTMFELMQPMASSYGVDLAINGDILSATFDPALIQSGAGVDFGTTSTSPGVIGSLASVPEPTSVLLLGSGLIGLGYALRNRMRVNGKYAGPSRPS